MNNLAILCAGQGAQTSDLFDRFPFTEKGLALKQRVISGAALHSDVKAWLNEPRAHPELISENRYAQPLICLFQAMVWAEIAEELPTPAMIAGFSLGEISCYNSAGAIDIENLVRLAGARAEFMDNASTLGRMVVVMGLPLSLAKPIAEKNKGHVAIVIADDHYDIGCLAENADALVTSLTAAGASDVRILNVTRASHTPIMDDAVGSFRAAFASTDIASPDFPIVAGVDASLVCRKEQAVQLLPEQIHQTVRWDLVMHRLLDSGCRIFLELGPGKQLSHMILQLQPDVQARSIEEFKTPSGIISWVKKSMDREG